VAFWSEHVEVWPYTPVQHRVPGHFNYGFQHQEFSNRGARPEWSAALGPAHPKEYPEERAKNQNPWATSKGSSPILLGFELMWISLGTRAQCCKERRYACTILYWQMLHDASHWGFEGIKPCFYCGVHKLWAKLKTIDTSKLFKTWIFVTSGKKKARKNTKHGEWWPSFFLRWCSQALPISQGLHFGGTEAQHPHPARVFVHLLPDASS
jgi:hypothetical protein